MGGVLRPEAIAMLVFLLTLLPLTLQTCLPQYDYMVRLYEASQEIESERTKVHSFASNGIYWTRTSLDFNFRIGSKETGLTVSRAELFIISHDQLRRLFRADRSVKLVFLLYAISRESEPLIYNQTIRGSDLTPGRYVSINLTPLMRRTALGHPRFRIQLLNTPSIPADQIFGEDCPSPFLTMTTNRKHELAYVTNIIQRKKRGGVGYMQPSSSSGSSGGSSSSPSIQYKDVTALEIPSFPCQRVKFELNLADIGWDSWLIVPQTVDIGVCQGTCEDETDMIPHALAKQKIAKLMPEVGEVCCQEAAYKEIHALYHVDGSVVKSILPQFVVSACKCR